MKEEEYVTLLDKAYADLPEVAHRKGRFEIPEVRGRLIKTRTLISNFRDIAKYFSRSTNHLSTFMLKELGVRGEVDERGELILHSRFQPGILNKTVQRYFKRFVQCPNCHSPDTKLDESQHQMTCNACGHMENVERL